MTKLDITVAGAGVLGLWQALTLRKAGHEVTLVERSPVPFAEAASRWAGAMLAPDCEAESAPPLVRDLGQRSCALWRGAFDGVVSNGTLVTAGARDAGELARFARATRAFQKLDGAGIANIEPQLAGRFGAALFYPHEAHFDAVAGLAALMQAARAAGVRIVLGKTDHDASGTAGNASSVLVDCRGFAARDEVKGLRGVRGERLLVRAPEVSLSRPVRLLHPRQPLYVVPQGDQRYVVGATVIEREDDGPMTLRSALELLGSAYALHPAFAEAAIIDLGAGVRPAFADNIPRIIAGEPRTIRVNGAYRHGFLLAPILAEGVAEFLATGSREHPLFAH